MTRSAPILIVPSAPAAPETPSPSPAPAPAPAAAPAVQQAAPAETTVPDNLRRSKGAAESEFRAADANGDGYLSQDEMRARFPNLGNEFKRVDRDGDGRVSPQEFFQAKRQMLERRLSK